MLDVVEEQSRVYLRIRPASHLLRTLYSFPRRPKCKLLSGLASPEFFATDQALHMCEHVIIDPPELEPGVSLSGEAGGVPKKRPSGCHSSAGDSEPGGLCLPHIQAIFGQYSAAPSLR